MNLLQFRLQCHIKKTPFIAKKYPKAHSNNRKHQYVCIFHIEENDNLSLLKYNSKMLV